MISSWLSSRLLLLAIIAFLLNNTNQYHYAHALGLTEYFISSYFFPGKFNTWYCSLPWLSIGMSTSCLAFISHLTCGSGRSPYRRAIRSLSGHDSCQQVVLPHCQKRQARRPYLDHPRSLCVSLDQSVGSNFYRYSRHPSYVGFFYWAIATQLLLGNIFSSIAFILVLGRFFSARIQGESTLRDPLLTIRRGEASRTVLWR